MSGLPKQQDHVEHFCATKSWTATNSETVQSRSLTAKPLILHSTMRTLRRKLQSLPAREMEKPAIYRNPQKSLKFARQTKIHQQKCHARRKPHTWRKWSRRVGRVGRESGESRGSVGGSVGGRLPHTHVYTTTVAVSSETAQNSRFRLVEMVLLGGIRIFGIPRRSVRVHKAGKSINFEPARSIWSPGSQARCRAQQMPPLATGSNFFCEEPYLKLSHNHWSSASA